MIKKKISIILSVLISLSVFSTKAFADEINLEVPTLEIPTLNIPDNMPDGNQSLKELYDKAKDGLVSQGLGINNYQDGLSEATPFTETDTFSLFKNKYGDLWNDLEVNNEHSSQGIKDKITTEDYNKMVSDLSSKYLPSMDKVKEQLGNMPTKAEASYIPSITISNSWNFPDFSTVQSDYNNALSEAQRGQISLLNDNSNINSFLDQVRKSMGSQSSSILDRSNSIKSQWNNMDSPYDTTLPRPETDLTGVLWDKVSNAASWITDKLNFNSGPKESNIIDKAAESISDKLFNKKDYSSSDTNISNGLC